MQTSGVRRQPTIIFKRSALFFLLQREGIKNSCAVDLTKTLWVYTVAAAEEAVLQNFKPVIPDEWRVAKRDPESRNAQQFQKFLDSGSRPVSLGLAGMTNYDTTSYGRGIDGRYKRLNFKLLI